VAAEGPGAALAKETIVVGAAVKLEKEGDLVAGGERLAGGLVGLRGEEGDGAGGRLGPLGAEVGAVNFIDGGQDGASLERRAIEPLGDDGKESGFEGLVGEPGEKLSLGVENGHENNSWKGRLGKTPA
jgi:hypothetical protein